MEHLRAIVLAALLVALSVGISGVIFEYRMSTKLDGTWQTIDATALKADALLLQVQAISDHAVENSRIFDEHIEEVRRRQKTLQDFREENRDRIRALEKHSSVYESLVRRLYREPLRCR